MKIKLLLALLTLPILARAEPAPAEANTVAVAAEPAIELAYLRANADDLAAAVKPVDAALAADPKNPALLYERAFALYAVLPSMHASADKRAMQAKLEEAVTVLERVKGQPWEAEAAALHGQILGELIGLKGGMSGMTLGPKSGQLLNRADKALPNNPRVLCFKGISLINTPATFGGDPAKGAALLQQALDLFAKSDPSASGPHWGRADTLAWLGIARQKAGDLAAARAAWEAALALEPDYAWVKFALVPTLDQKKSK